MARQEMEKSEDTAEFWMDFQHLMDEWREAAKAQ